MKHLIAVILAAGEGKRMKSKNSKVSHRILNKPIIEWVSQAAAKAGVDKQVVVVGHRADQVMECLGDRVEYVTQAERLGTGHAVMQAEEQLKGKEGCVIILNGDTPLITSETILRTVRYHEENSNSATVITALLDCPDGYGRVVRDGQGNVQKIVEHKDASEEEKNIREINSGIYCFTISCLMEALKKINNANSQGEYYLTDTLEILIKNNLKVGALRAEDSDEILGINDRLQLSRASEICRRKILERHMLEGVTIIDPASTFIGDDAEIGMDTVIYPGSIIEGKTVIGEDCIIGPDSRLVSAQVADGAEINKSVVIESFVGEKAHVGPFAYVRPGSHVGRNVKIGDFVEVKKSSIGDGTKISHLTYVGDAEVGKNVNLGCGVVFVNYDGRKKCRVVVGDNSFIGCNVNLIAPVTVKENAYIAAGSTITDEVPQNSLAIARSRQIVKENWVKEKDMKRDGK
ncbi:UDP-N-acetylglucosamine pyrophosphorylase /glucosamine-1-phosphate N-acetyltransferase [Anaerobacterium chartisolvens]|uniref:Bifunctional protein GlmU n=1 Tax=Anaerobacterium chartisolvens TaxID=1297424 RepID=A0A369BA73_9FIRM|nr:bifunctional UDP-N-acetylglucosamine diphosphorylase/glucosamine-1-phosphate N-acetyltransferase GlmU [Anaerobacterium chartisolvens]RCX18422.1 UDP-N-acetylglucosamine pyrophosphorylase /glucosamine-1-phosphate N-acetyltransferase [Anaerobacterium chartisolvens]